MMRSVIGGKLSFYKWFMNVFDLHYINDAENIEYLNRLFSNVLIVPYEMLLYDPNKFVMVICNFMGENPPHFNNKVYGKKLGPFRLIIVRIANHFFKPGLIYRRFNIKRFARRLRGLE